MKLRHTNLDSVGYYETFPPKRMNVSTETIEVTDSSGGKALKRILIAAKDFVAGEAIYDVTRILAPSHLLVLLTHEKQEQPIVSVLDPDLEGKGSHCSQCLRQIDEGTAIKPDNDRLSSAFCSKECQAKLTAESQSLLFGPEYAIPIELNPNQDAESAKKREDAQTAFARFVRESGGTQAVLVARFIARQVVNETIKLLPPDHPAATSTQRGADVSELTEHGYTLFDHMERVRYLELEGREAEAEQLRVILKANLQGLEDFVTDERYTVLVGKMAYNAYGISPGRGRDDKVRIEFLSFFLSLQIRAYEGVRSWRFPVAASIKCPTRRHAADARTEWHLTPNRRRLLPRFILREPYSFSLLFPWGENGNPMHHERITPTNLVLHAFRYLTPAILVPNPRSTTATRRCALSQRVTSKSATK
jgi:hypothetical protein